MIVFRLPWWPLWAANIALLWYAIFLGGGNRHDLLTVWAATFAPLEIVGGALYLRDRFRGRELVVARTFSLVMQYFANKQPGQAFWRMFVGWDAFPLLNVALVGAGVDVLVGGATFPAWGHLAGISMAGLAYGHWLNARKYDHGVLP